jgi:hypothetical protein
MRPVTERALRDLHDRRAARPATAANVTRNARARPARHTRWAPARAALWNALEGVLEREATVVIAGAGNGDDLPLREITEHAGHVTLVDVDPVALEQARRSVPRHLRMRITLETHDVTLGRADAITAGRITGPGPLIHPLPGAPFDLAVGDLLYSQLLYPGLVDAGLPADRIAALTRRHSPGLTRLVVWRLHASAPRVLHVHDPLGWWAGHEQPVDLDEILTADTDAALQLIARGHGPTASDPRATLGDAVVLRTSLWRWPFAEGVDYLACATLALTTEGGPGPPSASDLLRAT